ncbi:MAG: hypothetical protein IPO77_12350 [Acidobacteria bacterium]|nr:hypothetical protein [Acidobacteriota bacterium]
MKGSSGDILSDSNVAVTALAAPAYPVQNDESSEVRQALKRVANELHWSEEERRLWAHHPARARVLVKPNLVLHENEGPWGIEPLVTNLSLISAAVEEALCAEPGEVIVGDAPLQGCGF